MRANPLILAAAIGLSGCATAPYPDSDAEADADGVPCGQSRGESRVRIVIAFKGDYGTPDTDRCEVDEGTLITWRGEAGSRQAFAVVFERASPAGRDQPLKTRSSDVDGVQKLEIAAAGAPAHYPYRIVVNGVAVDPAIIIRPR